ncbi:hypothetical protein CPC08DRAFT_235056 [Agrocybe pediades]|nr:hypothetical protein CPC08DRAFT_235056 [Agrocybe pediades]
MIARLELEKCTPTPITTAIKQPMLRLLWIAGAIPESYRPACRVALLFAFLFSFSSFFFFFLSSYFVVCSYLDLCYVMPSFLHPSISQSYNYDHFFLFFFLFRLPSLFVSSRLVVFRLDLYGLMLTFPFSLFPFSCFVFVFFVLFRVE